MRVDYLLKCSAKNVHKRLLLFQLTITSSQMQWTSDCTKALASTKERGDKKALKSLKKKQVLKTNSRVTTSTVVCSFNFSQFCDVACCGYGYLLLYWKIFAFVFLLMLLFNCTVSRLFQLLFLRCNSSFV